MWAGGSGQMCGWTQDKQKDQFDWSIGSGGTPSVKTGPKFDHTLKTKQGIFFLSFLLFLLYQEKIRFCKRSFGYDIT